MLMKSVNKIEKVCERGVELKLVKGSARPSRRCYPTIDVVRDWTEEQCRTELAASLDDTAAALNRAAIILKVMIEKKYDTSKLPRAWVRAMLKIADGDMLPEVMRDFDGVARNHVARMPIHVQRQLCENSSVKVINEFGKIKTDKIQNLSMREISLALDCRGPRTVDEQRQIISSIDERPERNAPEPGTFEQAIAHFQASRERFGHLKELASLYSMIEILGSRARR